MDTPCIVIQPNATLKPRQAAALLVGMCMLSFSIAGILAFMGYWMIFPFAGLEMACLAAGLYVALRANQEREVLRVAGNNLIIERGRGAPQFRQILPLHWVQVQLRPAATPTDFSRVQLRYAGQCVEVGKVLSEEEREELATHLASWIQKARKFALERAA